MFQGHIVAFQDERKVDTHSTSSTKVVAKSKLFGSALVPFINIYH